MAFEWLHVIPFVGLASSNAQALAARPLLTRLVEQSLPGILVAAVGVYVNDAKQTEQIHALHGIVTGLQTELRGVSQELRSDVREIRHELYKPTLERPYNAPTK